MTSPERRCNPISGAFLAFLPPLERAQEASAESVIEAQQLCVGVGVLLVTWLR